MFFIWAIFITFVDPKQKNWYNRNLLNMKFTLTSIKNNRRTLKCIEQDEIVRMIRNMELTYEVNTFRNMSPTLSNIKIINSTPVCLATEDNLPSVYFSAEYFNLKGQTMIRKANPLFLIEISHLVEYKEVAYLRKLAGQLPQTRMAFIGADGRSLEIVCGAKSDKNIEEMEPSDVERLIKRAYSMAVKYYQAQLGTSVDMNIPTLASGCKMSADPEIYYNPDSLDFAVVNIDAEDEEIKKMELTKDSEQVLPGFDLRHTQRIQYENYLSQAIEANLDKSPDESTEGIIRRLAYLCHEDGLPKEMCISRTLGNPALGSDEMYVRMVFDNAYLKDIVKGMPFKHLSPEMLLTLKTKAFMEDRWQMRRNVLTGVVEYRVRDGQDRAFVPLTQYAINSMTQEALLAGLKSWDKDVRRYIDSDMIPEFDPINDYLERLPAWDGEDRIEELAQRVPTDNKDWAHNFHVWMLSMVAHWMGKDLIHGNAYTPLLIGAQGCGKSSFCRRILPPSLDSYYYDRIDFKNEQSADLALTRFALINIDEFDQLSTRRQAILKYLLQKSSVKTRRPYGMAIEELRRYASFIGTTNNPSPLSDPTGSRRFICITVDGLIDFKSSIEHDQLYAQAIAEINAGARYWFDDKETAIIMKQNKDFEMENGLSTMVSTFFKPTNDERNGEWLGIAEVLLTLRGRFKNLKDDIGTMQKLGKQLKEMHFVQHRSTGGKSNYLIERV